jgi:pimeloyl-ACP methyl ester carboxylesterase
MSIRTDPAVLDDLRRRLRATRWPDAPADAGWTLGADVPALRELVAYWADGYDAEGREAAVDALPHHRIRIDGHDIHYVHVPAVVPPGVGAPGAPALLLAHGWPDSFWRYLPVIPLLTDPGAHGGDPADAVDVIVPDMPGFGYSSAPDPVLDSRDVAELWARLMTGLGHDRFLAAGGDIGSAVVRYLALNHPERVVAVHRMDAGMPVFDGDPDSLSPEERDWIAGVARWGAAEGAYAAMHRTKPQTAAVGLTDSPAGLAAWVGEKLRSWSDGTGLFGGVDRDTALDLLTASWVTGRIGSSMRMYAANGAIPVPELNRRVEVPSGFSLFAGDLTHPPRAWLDRVADTRFVRVHERGGHFAPVEVPEVYAADLREFFRPYR